MDDGEVRCEHCARKHAKPPLLATWHGTKLLQPVRLDSAQAKRLGIPRSGLFWAEPVVDPDGLAVLRCRRCGTVRRVPAQGLYGGQVGR